MKMDLGRGIGERERRIREEREKGGGKAGEGRW